MQHIHVTSDRTTGTVGIGKDGKIWHDGKPISTNAVYGLRHGFDPANPKHAPHILDAIVKRLDYSTYVGAHHCKKPECPYHRHQS